MPAIAANGLTQLDNQRPANACRILAPGACCVSSPPQLKRE
jgi:hypothetical protein